MSKYRLNVNVTGDDLNTIYAAKQRIIIAKHTAEQKSNVAWVSFKPFEHNTVDWETDFALYAATGEIQGGAKIAKLSDCSGQTQINATFANGYFSSSQPDNQIGPNSYEITNSDKDNALLTFGLAQSISVNGTAYDEHPINAILVPRGNSAVMTPIEKIDVFLESNIESSTVLSRIYTKCITLVYQGDTTELSLNYDPINGIFYPASK